MRTVGIDLSDRKSAYCVMDAERRVIRRDVVAMTRASLAEAFAKGPRQRMVIEAGTHSPWVSRTLEGLGHDVIVANPRKVAWISKDSVKTDRNDAEKLARLGAMDVNLLHPIRHRGERTQEDLAVARARDLTVTMRTRLVNSIRAVVKTSGEVLPRCSAESFPKKVRGHVPEGLRAALDPLVALVDVVNAAIAQYDREIERIAQARYPEAEHLRQVPGVGPLTSLVYVLTLEDPKRFRDSRRVPAYFGLVPRKRQSGDRDPQQSISKTGNAAMRRLLVMSAQYLLGPNRPDTDLRRWGLTLAQRGGPRGKKRAVVAVARKLAVVLHRLWQTGKDYVPLREPAATKKPRVKPIQPASPNPRASKKPRSKEVRNPAAQLG
jgi:transposase